jgi:hypothetical protein
MIDCLQMMQAISCPDGCMRRLPSFGLLMFADRTSASDLICQSIDPAFANPFDGPLSRTE